MSAIIKFIEHPIIGKQLIIDALHRLELKNPLKEGFTYDEIIVEIIKNGLEDMKKYIKEYVN